jgi:hypothetical protein
MFKDWRELAKMTEQGTPKGVATTAPQKKTGRKVALRKP